MLEGTDREPLIIPADKESIIENICTRPSAVDWDRDGELDLVVGNFAGSFYVFTGEGQGRFLPEPKQIMTDNGPLKIQGHHSDPFPVDWDNDGDIDLVSGSSAGGVQWAENAARAGEAPALEPFRDLIKPGQRIQYGEPLGEDELTGPTGSTRVWVDDVNADGKLDVLVGDSVTLAAVANGLTKEELDKKQSQWQDDLAKVSEEYRAAAGDQQKLQEYSAKIQKLHAQRAEFIKEDRTGFVWLYLQE
ncbi:MAG: VCBS repeat-containing protein [Pirellulales bacterium]